MVILKSKKEELLRHKVISHILRAYNYTTIYP